MFKILKFGVVFLLLLSSLQISQAFVPAIADTSSASDHAPIGVMVDHRHKKGEVMVSYRYMRMNMDGSRIGTDPVTPEQIATTVPNRFFGTPGQPPTRIGDDRGHTDSGGARHDRWLPMKPRHKETGSGAASMEMSRRAQWLLQ